MSEAEISTASAATCISMDAPRMQKLKPWRHDSPVHHTEPRLACHLPVSQLDLCQKLLKAQRTEALQIRRSAGARMPVDHRF